MAENKNNLKVLSDDWSDDLMIKDAQGNLHHLKDDVKDLPDITSKVSLVTKPALAPKDDKFIDTEPLSGSKDKKDLSFHPDDDVDIKTSSANLPVDDSKKYSLEKITDKLISKHGLKFTETDSKKFSDIFFDFFRNRKNAIVIRELLSKDVFINGKVLSEDVVNSLVSVAKAIKENINQEAGLVVRAEDMVQKSDAEFLQPVKVVSSKEKIELADIEKEINEETFDDSKSPGETQGEIQNILSGMSGKTNEQIDDKNQENIIADDGELEIKDEKQLDEPIIALEQTKDSVDSEKVDLAAKMLKDNAKESPITLVDQIKDKSIDAPVKTEKEELAVLPKVSRPSSVPVVKQQVVDVVAKSVPKPIEIEKVAPKPVPKATLTGAVEELQNLTLENFRRLGNSPSEQAEKLLVKVNLLEKDSVTKKAQGIEAWRNSEVYRTYLDLGEESLSQNKDVAAIIEQYNAAAKQTLSLEEFSAISDLNKQLRF
ncbi:hypothetical protein HOD19_01620 [bacterium]|nr:hypothetical protein [bacterium]MBT4648902.1 hypothetical protein [bacterium]